jgi:hypothetical protein
VRTYQCWLFPYFTHSFHSIPASCAVLPLMIAYVNSCDDWWIDDGTTHFNYWIQIWLEKGMRSLKSAAMNKRKNRS